MLVSLSRSLKSRILLGSTLGIRVLEERKGNITGLGRVKSGCFASLTSASDSPRGSSGAKVFCQTCPHIESKCLDLCSSLLVDRYFWLTSPWEVWTWVRWLSGAKVILKVLPAAALLLTGRTLSIWQQTLPWWGLGDTLLRSSHQLLIGLSVGGQELGNKVLV